MRWWQPGRAHKPGAGSRPGTGTGSRPRPRKRALGRTGPRRRRGITVALAALLLSGCATAAASPGERQPHEVRLPGGGIVTVTAQDILGSGQFLPDRENYAITDQHWTTTMDGDTPIVVGLVQAMHTMHYRGYTEDEYVTFVLGVSADEDARELTRTRILRGAAHTAALAGRSDQGVVAVLLEGELNTNVPRDSRVIGVDAVRGTEVWVKEHGFPRSGEGTAWFYAASSPDACATEVEHYDVASGVVRAAESILNTDPQAGGRCLTANDPEPPAGLAAPSE